MRSVVILVLSIILGATQGRAQNSARGFFKKKELTDRALISENKEYLIKVKRNEMERFLDINKPLILRRISDHEYLVKGGFQSGISVVDQVYEVGDDWKLSSSIRGNQAIGESTFLIRSDQAELTRLKLIELLNVEVEESAYGLISVVMNEDLIQEVLTWQEVSFIQKLEGPKVEANIASHDLSVNGVNWLHHYRPSLTGSGITLALKEMSFDVNDIDLWPRTVVSNVENPEVSSHANAMASIAAGAGNTSALSRGVAFQSELVSSDFERVIPDPMTYFTGFDIRIQNHSYGLAISNEYDAVAAAYDELAQSLPELLHVFSSGNSGFLVPDNGEYAGLGTYANLTGGLKMAKNILTIGSVDEFGVLSTRSSRGPAYDGRVKPELVAYGKGGTSEAAALVSGTSILLNQAYEDLFFKPSLSSELKSILIAGAQPLDDSAVISYTSGFGLMSAKRSLEVIEKSQILNGVIEGSQVQSHTLEVPSGVKSVRIALVWNDPAANPGDFKALVNDLNMTVTEVGSGDQWFPWVLDPTADLSKLSLAPTRKVDTLNNVELITVETPMEGTFDISIATGSSADLPQPYHISYLFEFDDEFEWVFPTASDVVEYDESLIARFENTYDSEGLLYVKSGLGEWDRIGTIDNKSLHLIESELPIGITQLRVDFGTNSYLSDDFLITESVDIDMQFLCDDEFLVSWNPIDGADLYGLYRIDESGVLEEVMSTSDTSIFLNRNSEDWNLDVLTVIPKINGLLGSQAQALNFINNGTGCYFNNFTASVSDATVSLGLDLSTIFNIEGIAFEKWDGESFLPIHTETLSDNTSFSFNDVNENSGYFVYRARINLLESIGDGLKSSTTSSIELPVILPSSTSLFPNPLSRGEDLNLLSSNLDAKWLVFIDSQGNRVKVLEVDSGTDSFTLEGLGAGLFLYQLIDVNNQIIKTGRLIVN
ncbi:S8 family serine peptidase [Roseivirga sp. E12]|uniref:S8 family serine peptidase n=1 Tax=Roseivirga sp. E12 TaxID=2819237 RepID=UPI001ABC64C1|nr:S8 family serine peptidase [Roseivirga sp. E12]MBO3699309.1 S8 family serine peptidase [Roseivirga sp. E12]